MPNVDSIASSLAVALQVLVLGSLIVAGLSDRRRGTVAPDLAGLVDHDPLTGLANRSWLMHRLGRVVRPRPGEVGRGPALVVLDLDNFEAVNNALGQTGGDAVLTEVARRLRRLVEANDVVARLGGDSFAVLLEDADRPRTEAVVERIRGTLDKPVIVSDSVCLATASMGVVQVETGADAATVLRHAGIALAAAKTAGPGRAEFFDAGLGETVVARQQLEADLALALPRRELVVHYQPVVELAIGRVVSVEALVRWQHPELGLLPPGRFIGMAEETGIIHDLGAWVLEEACAQVTAWNEWSWPAEEPLGVGVNVSPRQLSLPDFVETVTGILSRVAIDPRLVTLEITESALAADTEATIARLERLKAQGVTLAMDDFGMGYASLSYLRRLPFDILKIDRSFVAGIGSGEEEWALAAAIVRLAASLGKETLAEGVETHAQRAHLRALGCRLAQGFLYARPLPPAEIEELILRDRRLRGHGGTPAATTTSAQAVRRPGPCRPERTG